MKITPIKTSTPTAPKTVSNPFEKLNFSKVNFDMPCDSVSFSSKIEENKPKDISFTGNKIVMLGAPASGKGTMTEYLQNDLKVPHVDVGGILRDAIKNGTELGKQAESYVVQGKLMPDEIVSGLVKDRLSQDDCKSGFILDGFPRTIKQAQALDEIMADRGENIQVVNIDLDIPKQDFLDRVVNRRLCSNKDCGAVYNVKFKPPVEDGVCDKCQSPLIYRNDDTEEVALSRLDTYEKQTKPLIEYYQNQGNLITVKASNGSSDNYGIIKEKLAQETD